MNTAIEERVGQATRYGGWRLYMPTRYRGFGGPALAGYKTEI
jgi:hypothetical protein